MHFVTSRFPCCLHLAGVSGEQAISIFLAWEAVIFPAEGEEGVGRGSGREAGREARGRERSLQNHSIQEKCVYSQAPAVPIFTRPSEGELGVFCHLCHPPTNFITSNSFYHMSRTYYVPSSLHALRLILTLLQDTISILGTDEKPCPLRG